MPEPSGNLQVQFQNRGRARANGVEVALRAPITDRIEARIGYSFQETRDKEAGGQLTNSPQHLGDVALLFPLLLGVQAGAELQVVSPRETLAGNHTPTAVLANLTVNGETPVPGLGASAGFYNIFNQHYDDPAGPEHVQDEISQNGFTFRLQLRYRF